MSLGDGKSQALDSAVNRAVDSGMRFVVAAGGDNRDGCSYSPAAAEKAITVGGSTRGFTPLTSAGVLMSSPLVSMFIRRHRGQFLTRLILGLTISSTWIGSDTAANTISGTSMAIAHVSSLFACPGDRYSRSLSH